MCATCACGSLTAFFAQELANIASRLVGQGTECLAPCVQTLLRHLGVPDDVVVSSPSVPTGGPTGTATVLSAQRATRAHRTRPRPAGHARPVRKSALQKASEARALPCPRLCGRSTDTLRAGAGARERTKRTATAT